MSRTRPLLSRTVGVGVAAVLACAVVAPAQAAPPEPALGVPARADLPTKAKGSPPAWSGRAFRKGVVSVANPYGAQAGARILEQGGNAVDAAVAIAYALNVVEPQSAGIGGGGFMLIHLADSDETFAIDSRETAPAGATPDMFVGVSRPSLQGVAVGVPGMVRGTAHAVEQYGELKLGTVLEPAIELAGEGFAATPRYTAVSCNSRALNSPESAAFFCPGGVPAATGSLVQNEALARTFRLIAENGPDCFYEYLPELGCDIAKGIVEGQEFGTGGSMDYTDLEGYEAVERDPVEGTYRGYGISSMAPPSSGGLTVLQVLGMLERFPLGDEAAGFGFGELKTVSAMTDAMRLAFADRAVWMADADFVPVPQAGLVDPTYLAGRSAAIVPGTRLTPNPVAGDPRPFASARQAVADPVDGPGETTTHFSVVDDEGNMVSYTNTIESSHGIGVFAGYEREDGSFRNHGFLLNNELTDFNLAPTTNPFTGEPGYNDVQPGKRPRSSMAPSMIFSPKGEPLVAYGSPGGATIINSVLNVTINLIDHGMSLQAAIDAPRVSTASAGGVVSLEPGFPDSLVSAMTGLGYAVNRSEVGSVQAVLVHPRTGKQYGAADSRREGTVIGLPR